MKKAKKRTLIIVVLLIALFSYASFFGFSSYYGAKGTIYTKSANDIRWGIDIQGGVEAVFTPDYDISLVTDEMMNSAESVITTRLVGANITDYEVYTDSEEKQIIVRFPWQSDEEDYDPTKAVEELGTSAVLTFIEGSEYDESKIILKGDDVEAAVPQVNQEDGSYCVGLTLSSAGKSKFASATERLASSKGTISIWMDKNMISAPTVQNAITDGQAIITGNFTYEEVSTLANQISSGALPFALTVDNASLRVVSPTLGADSLNSMLIAGVIAFAAICLMLIVLYRLPGLISCIALLGQVAGIIACTSGFVSGFDSFTLTIPGITGIILSIGMGVDANVITNERIKEELRRGKTVDGAITTGFGSSFWAIFDGNITTIIVAAILMGVFGPTGGIWSKILWPFMTLYNYTIGLIPGLAIANNITGSIYSFGFTLLIGIIFNFVMGVWASRAMLKSATRYKFLRKSWLYGGAK
ncbi:MAG: SecD/SecF family protein translocase subunit [Clostridia bacterium]|nr:SecD/SecF family protein translocase subunit [Clostridia bacterium]